MTSWTQFFKNLPIVWIAFLLMYAGTFTTEYDSKTLILILSKGMPRYRALLAKTTVMLLAWTLGFWLCFGVTCGYNLYFWEDTIPQNLMSLCIGWWIFGIWTIALVVIWSVVLRGYGNVILCVGGSVLVVYLVGLIPKVSRWMPTALMSGGGLLITGESAPYQAIILACLTAVALVVQAIPILNKKQL
jgi:ABC-2 type transport system permease protein